MHAHNFKPGFSIRQSMVRGPINDKQPVDYPTLALNRFKKFENIIELFATMYFHVRYRPIKKQTRFQGSQFKTKAIFVVIFSNVE